MNTHNVAKAQVWDPQVGFEGKPSECLEPMELTLIDQAKSSRVKNSGALLYLCSFSACVAMRDQLSVADLYVWVNVA